MRSVPSPVPWGRDPMAFPQRPSVPTPVHQALPQALLCAIPALDPTRHLPRELTEVILLNQFTGLCLWRLKMSWASLSTLRLRCESIHSNLPVI